MKCPMPVWTYRSLHCAVAYDECTKLYQPCLQCVDVLLLQVPAMLLSFLVFQRIHTTQQLQCFAEILLPHQLLLLQQNKKPAGATQASDLAVQGTRWLCAVHCICSQYNSWHWREWSYVWQSSVNPSSGEAELCHYIMMEFGQNAHDTLTHRSITGTDK